MNTLAVGIIKTDPSGRFNRELINSIKDNIGEIDEILFTGYKKDLETDIQIHCLNLDSDNKAFLRNSILENCSSDYILWLSNSSELDFDFVQEARQIIEEYPQADILYPNEVIVDMDGRENVKKYTDYFSRELELLRTIQLERSIPEFGIITKKDLFNKTGKFDEKYEDFEFYSFLWNNIKQIKLKHIKFSFCINKHTDSFIDTSFGSKAIRDNLGRYDLKELFPLLQWDKNQNLALSTAYHILGDVLTSYYDMYNGSEFYRKSLIHFHNKISIQKVIDTYYNMGLFQEALQLLRTDQGFTEEEIDQISSKIYQAKTLVENAEKSITQGNIREIFHMINDIYNAYSGAPVINIIGVIEYLGGNIENAFKFFYKAATLNPLAEDILNNLVDTAKQLGKEEKVKGLINRLLG